MQPFEHYLQAEELLTEASRESDQQISRDLVAEALVHATLALVYRDQKE